MVSKARAMTYSKCSVVAGIACAAFYLLLFVCSWLSERTEGVHIADGLFFWLEKVGFLNILLTLSGLTVVCFEISRKREPQTSKVGLYMLLITLVLILANLIVGSV